MSNNKKKNKRNNSLSPEEKSFRKNTAIFNTVHITLFISVIAVTGLVFSFAERPEISEIEKRELAKKPELSAESYFSGSYADEYSAYYSDTVPFREKIVEIASWFDTIKGISAPKFYGNVSVVADDEGNLMESDPVDIITEPAQTEPPQTTAPVTETTPVETTSTEPVQTEASENEASQTSAPVTETTAPPETVATSAQTAASTQAAAQEPANVSDFANNGIVVDGVKMYGDNAGVMLFGGNKKAGSRYAELLSKYKAAMGDDVNVYNIVVPTSVEFYLPEQFRKYSSSEKNAIDHIYQSYTADIIPVDAYSEIAAHTDEYIYLRTDHHWSHRGAYYAYAALVKAMGETPLNIDTDYEIRQIDGYVGSLYGYTNDPILKNSPELFTYYKPKSNYKTYYYNYDSLTCRGEGTLFYDNVGSQYCYGVFLGADAIHTQIITENTTGRKVCVFKESYGNAFVPYLVDSFDEIYVIDIRYFGKNAVTYMKEKGITDVIFINNAFAANTNSLIDKIEYLYANPYGTLTADQIAAIYPPAQTTATAPPAQTAAAVTTTATTAKKDE